MRDKTRCGWIGRRENPGKHARDPSLRGGMTWRWGVSGGATNLHSIHPFMSFMSFMLKKPLLQISDPPYTLLPRSSLSNQS
jgi:hypothetical protein